MPSRVISERLIEAQIFATATTSKIDCWSLDVGSFTVTLAGVGGTINASYQVQVSNTPKASTTNPWDPPDASWVALGSPVTTAALGAKLVSVPEYIRARWMRLVATVSSGDDGTLSVDVFAKGIG